MGTLYIFRNRRKHADMPSAKIEEKRKKHLEGEDETEDEKDE